MCLMIIRNRRKIRETKGVHEKNIEFLHNKN